MKIKYEWGEKDVEVGRRVFDDKGHEFIIGWRNELQAKRRYMLIDLRDGMSFKAETRKGAAAHLTKYGYTPLKAAEIQSLAVVNRREDP